MINYSVYKNFESDQWVTFVHGAGGSSSIWYRQIKEFKKHFNVILLDLRGHGKSKYHFKNVFEKKYSFKSISNDIVEVLRKEKIKSSHFIGISLGTILIRQLAEQYPKMVKSMIMAGEIKLNEKNEVVRVGGVKYTIKNGVIYDSKLLLKEVKDMVRIKKEEENFVIKQPGIK